MFLPAGKVRINGLKIPISWKMRGKRYLFLDGISFEPQKTSHERKNRTCARETLMSDGLSKRNVVVSRENLRDGAQLMVECVTDGS